MWRERVSMSAILAEAVAHPLRTAGAPGGMPSKCLR
jgi:hypothetical protein